MSSRTDFVFSPNEISTFGDQYINFRMTHKEAGVPFPQLDVAKKFYPLIPGEVCSIIARPGNGKTGLMMNWARARANWLLANGHEDRVVVYATLEQSIEELYTFSVAAQKRMSITNIAKGELTEAELKSARDAASERISLPLWFVGHSVMRRNKARGRPVLTTDLLAESLMGIEEWGEGQKIDCVFVDYIQRIGLDDYSQPSVGFMRAMDAMKNSALALATPFVVGVQASREVEQLQVQIPEQHHAQWTSNIEQTSDRIISLVRPRKYRREGEFFGSTEVRGISQMLITVLKQKLGEDNFVNWVYFDPIYNHLDRLEKEVQ